jgi:replicative DNA helicase
MAVLRSLTSTATKRSVRATLLKELQPKLFGTAATQELFESIKEIYKDTGDVPTFRILKRDTGLSDEAKALIRGPADSATDVLASAEVAPALSRLRQQLYCRIVADTAEAATGLVSGKKAPKLDTVLELFSSSLSQMSNLSGNDDDFVHGGVGNESGMADLALKQLKNRAPNEYIKTGWETYDALNFGFRRGSLVIMAANYGGGKSSAALTLKRNMHYGKHAVLTGSLEVGKDELMDRLLACICPIPSPSERERGITGVTYDKIVSGSLSKKERLMALRMFDKFDADVEARYTFYTPTRELTIDDFFMSLPAHKYDVVIIDYIGLLKKLVNKNMLEHQAFGEIARVSKLYAERTGCVVIMLAQLDAESRKVKYSQGIGQNADVLLKWVCDQDSKDIGCVEVEIEKCRGGKTGSFFLSTDFAYMQMNDVTQTEMAAEASTKKKSMTGDGDGKRFGGKGGKGGGNDPQAEAEARKKLKKSMLLNSTDIDV